MKKYFLAAWLLLAIAKSSFSQNFALNWNITRLLDTPSPSFYLGAEFNTPKSERKTLQVSIGYGMWSNSLDPSVNAYAAQTIRWGIEQKYFVDKRWEGSYFSYAVEGRNSLINVENWVFNCDTGDCFEEIVTRKSTRNAYTIMGRTGLIRQITKTIYVDGFVGVGIKLTKKTPLWGQEGLNQNFLFTNNHYLYPAFSLGFRVGFILK